MTKLQRDLLRACYSRKVNATYEDVHAYAYPYNKYDNMSIREIAEVAEKLKELYLK